MAKRVLEVQITGDTKNLDRALGKSQKGLGSFAKSAAKTGALVGAGGLAAGVFESVKAFEESRKVAAQTQAVLKSTGHSANVTAKEVGALATAISNKTGIDDEAIQSSENMLLTFGKIRNETGKNNDIFNQATKAAVDMSVAMGTDAKSAAIVLGKALQDPVKGASALGKAGVDKSVIAQAQALGKAGHQLAAQKLLLKELKTEFGGSAAAQATSLDKLKVSFGNLSESVGGLLAPTIDKGATKVRIFIDQMQKGTGAGGRFVDQMKSAATTVKNVVTSVVSFGSKHPLLVKMAAGVVAFGVALKALRFVSAITGLTNVINLAKKLGQSKAGTALAENVAKGARAMPGMISTAISGAKNVVKRILGRAGASGGTALAETAASSAGSSISPSMGRQKGRFSKVGTGAGKWVGRGIGVGIVAGVALAAPDIANALAHVIQGSLSSLPGPLRNLVERVMGIHGSVSGKYGGSQTYQDLKDALPGKTRNPIGGRKGGKYQGGGLVPAVLSPQELGVLPDGTSFTVPGSRVAADTVPMMLPSGTSIFTDSGQSMLASGASMQQALAMQAPHFAKGGTVKGRVSWFNDPHTASGVVGVPGLALNLKAGTDAGWNNSTTQGWMSRIKKGGLKNAATAAVAIKGHHATLPIIDLGPAGSTHRAIDVTAEGVKKLGFTLKNFPTDATGTATLGGVKPGTGKPGYSYLKAPAVTHPLLANDLLPLVDDALLGGITAGMEGTSRLGVLNSVLSGVESDSFDYPTKVSVAGKAGSARGGSQKGLPARVAKMQAFGNRVSKKQLAYLWGGYGEGGRYDCSGLVSRELNYGGFMSGRRDTVGLRSAGVRGPGKYVTWGVRGGAGRSGHTMIKVGDQFFEAGGNKPTGRRSGWNGSFDMYHPKGFRGGGVAGMDVAPKARARLAALLAAGGSTDPMSPKFIGWGMQSGGYVSPYARWRQGATKKKRRGLSESKRWANLLGLIGGTPGPDKAQTALINFQKRARKASEKRLLAERKAIRSRIKRLHAHGTTGQERIQIKRLRGAESFADDELGRRIGYPLAASDKAQADADHLLATFDDRMTIQGVAEGSPEYIAEQKAETASALSKVTAAQAGNYSALTLARRTGNKAAIKQAEDELQENNDKMLSLRAALIKLDATVAQQVDNTQALIDLNKQVIENQNKLIVLTTQQGPQLLAGVVAAVNGGIGGRAGLGTQSVGFAGGMARY